MPIISNVIKFYPPPDNCSKCWKERKKFFRAILPKVNFTNDELIIQIQGTCHTEKITQLKNFLISELEKMNKIVSVIIKE